LTFNPIRVILQRMKELIYAPQPNATPDEIMQVLKLFAYTTYPPEHKSSETLFKIYDSMSIGAQRHFRIKEISQ
jgi:hypothetical protein